MPIGSLSSKFANIEDMVLVSFADGTFDDAEKPLILAFEKSIGITNEQFKQVVRQAKFGIASSRGTRTCPACSSEVPLDAKFCPKCGGSLGQSDQETAVAVAYDIPTSGVAIEFAESSASGFVDAVRRAKDAPVQATCVKARKTWYLVAWPKSEIAVAARLASDLKGIRNRKVWLDGKEARWDDVFSFTWCSAQRESAYRPVEYCFGMDEKRLNIWGCKQVRLEWNDWSDWFSYGSFKRAGILKKYDIFVFDKARIRHELESNLFRFRLCPHLNFPLIESVLAKFPNEVEIKPNGDWTYKRDDAESPGAIKISMKTTEDGYTFNETYFSTGVTPRSPIVGLQILEKALKSCGSSTEGIKPILSYRGD